MRAIIIVLLILIYMKVCQIERNDRYSRTPAEQHRVDSLIQLDKKKLNELI
jgi:hypothetical protein